MRSYHLEQLEERLKDLKQEIADLKENRQQQIDKHVERLLEGKLGRPRGRRRGPGGGHSRRKEQ
jgi:TolA-binding protein